MLGHDSNFMPDNFKKTRNEKNIFWRLPHSRFLPITSECKRNYHDKFLKHLMFGIDFKLLIRPPMYKRNLDLRVVIVNFIWFIGTQVLLELKRNFKKAVGQMLVEQKRVE